MQAESCMGPHARLSASPTCSLPGSARSPASRSCLVACLRAVLFQLKLQLSLFAFTARQRLVLLLTFVSKTIKRIAKLMLLLNHPGDSRIVYPNQILHLGDIDGGEDAEGNSAVLRDLDQQFIKECGAELLGVLIDQT